MKVKLPCCEINQKCPNKHFECDQCECTFEKKEFLDVHDREIHKVQFTGKRKLNCCIRNETKRMRFFIHSCDYCECVFQKRNQLNNHISFVHKCQDCHRLVLTADIRADHINMHAEEKRKREEKKRQREQKDDDLILNYVKKDKLDEYQCEPDYEPDPHYIFTRYRLSKEELLKYEKKFKQIADSLDCFDDEYFTSEQIIFLFENDALCIEEVTSFLDSMMYRIGDDDIVDELIEYYLDKDYEIKKEWVAKVIKNNALIERIKQNYTYTFQEIYDARERDSICDESWDEFYVQVHKHFPDPDFKDPFADPFDDFKCVANDHVSDHLRNRYFYDKENDKLSIVVNGDREIPLDNWKQLLQNNLEELIKKYNNAIDYYEDANDKVSKLFEEREEELDRDITENERLHILDWTHDEIYGDALPTRNYYANEVSKLYFAIAMKKSDTELYEEPRYLEHTVWQFRPLTTKTSQLTTEPATSTEPAKSTVPIKTTKVIVPANLSFLKLKIDQTSQGQIIPPANKITLPANISISKIKINESLQCQSTSADT